MFAWIVTTAQIAAILVCPLTCSAGQCQGGSCCAVASHEAPIAVPCKPCCCEKQERKEEPSAPAIPGKPACQGVCGGAIFEKACDLPVELSFAWLLPTESDVAAWAMPEVRPAIYEADLQTRGNYGRSLRARYASFLC